MSENKNEYEYAMKCKQKFMQNTIENNIIATANGQYITSTYDGTYHWSINLTSIQSKLIYFAGRYVDNWCSDILYVIKAMQEMLDDNTPIQLKEKAENGTNIIWAALRKNGVDQILRMELNDNISSDYYRKVFGIAFDVDDNELLTVTLKDMTEYRFND